MACQSQGYVLVFFLDCIDGEQDTRRTTGEMLSATAVRDVGRYL